MVIDVNKHILTKTYSGSLDFVYAPPERLITVPFTSFEGKAKVSLEYWILEDDSVEVKGKVEYVISGSCSRCLRPARKAVSEEISAYFVPLGGKKVDYDDYVYERGIVDLTSCVDDAIMCGMPFSLICGDDCPGIDYNLADLNK